VRQSEVIVVGGEILSRGKEETVIMSSLPSSPFLLFTSSQEHFGKGL
jgi:hypothetical protein